MASEDCSDGYSWDGLVKMCLPSKTKTIAKLDCSGQIMDNLVNTCVHSRAEETRPELELQTESQLQTVVNQVRGVALTTLDDSVLGPALWVCVVLATVGSILALVLWFIIYRRQTRLRSTSEDAEPGLEPLQKNGQAEAFQTVAEAPSSCPHLLLGAQTGSKWEEGFVACSGPAKHAGTEEARELPVCSTVREHKIPLPATELGGTALVTTKTV